LHFCCVKDKKLIVALASDHEGFSYKETLVMELPKLGFSVINLGTSSEDPVDYPDVAESLADALRQGEADRGILICSSGVGVSVAANKFPRIRAGLCHDAYSAHQGVEHDGMNVLCLGAGIVGIELARDIIKAFLNARFDNLERHCRRLSKLADIERRFMKTPTQEEEGE